MTPARWRLIPFQQTTGPIQMALDEYLATHHTNVPILRFYQWMPFAISLGYHQSAASIHWTTCTEAGIDVVRRPTGGRAIYHAEELTYAVIIPITLENAKHGIHSVHNQISRAIANGILRYGVKVALRATGSDLRQHYKNTAESVACFSSTARYELQIDGKKVVGSAQRRYPGSILQHGSILLGKEHTKLPLLLRTDEKTRSRISTQLCEQTTDLLQYSTGEIRVEKLIRSIQAGFEEIFRCRFEDFPEENTAWQSIRDSSEKYRILPNHETASSSH